MEKDDIRRTAITVALISAFMIAHALVTSWRSTEPMAYSDSARGDRRGQGQRGHRRPPDDPGAHRQPRSRGVLRVDDPELYRELAAHKVKVRGAAEAGAWQGVLAWILPVALLVLFWGVPSSRRFGGGQADLMTVGRSKAKVFMEKEVKVRKRVAALLAGKRGTLVEAAERLLVNETLSGEELRDLAARDPDTLAA